MGADAHGNFIRPPFEPQGVVRLFDDFTGDTMDLNDWNAVSNQATGGTDWAYDATAGNPANGGWVSGTTGTGDNDCEAIYGGLNWMANRAGIGPNMLIFESRINMPSVAGVGMSAGFTDARTESASLFSYATTTWTTTPDDGVAWSFDTDGTTDLFRGIGTKATVDTAAVDGPAPATDTPVVVRIEIDAVGSAHFYYNGTKYGAVPNAVTITVPLAPFVEISCRAGSAAKVGECDYVFVSCGR